MNVTPFQCQFCENKPFFARKFTLERHIASKHGILTASNRRTALEDEKSTAFSQCVHCSKTFRFKHNLRRHITAVHPDVNDNEQFVKCAHCPKKFRFKHNLLKHIAALHRNANVNEKLHKCFLCPSVFKRKYLLRHHIQKVHLVEESRFRCFKCSNVFCSFSSKRNLNRHISFKHGNSSTRFECFHCSSIFSQKYHLRRHIENIHLAEKPKTKESRAKCLKCSNLFYSTKVLNKHYVDVHGVILNYQEFEFDSIESYKQWLENHQHETLTRFTIWYRKKLAASYCIQRLICHRSGDIRSSLTVDSRKRCLKSSGYKRLGGICPAEIRLRIRGDGKCFVRYQTTHVGHDIGDESELRHIYLTNEEKNKIAAEIQSGVPLAQIVNRMRLSRLSNSGENISRLRLVNRKDVRNIAASQNLGLENREFFQPECDLIDMEVKIAEHKDDIVFYKRQTEEDTQINVFDEEDFVLIIITPNQERYLRTYGHKVVCLDGTRFTGFVLHTLSVFDVDEEGLPAAYLLTNRNDQRVVDIFLASIRNRVGILVPHILITDMQTIYYNSWTKIMKDPTYYLFGTWHVHEAWRKNYCKIANKTKRDDVRAKLLRLSRESDPVKFEISLDLLLFSDDDELTNFIYYFQQNYGSNAQRWANCYRTKAGINADIAAKSFHKSFKCNLAKSEKIRSLAQCLVSIFDYLTLLETNILEKNVRGKVTNKLSILRNRHRAACEQFEKDALSRLIVITSDMYMVQSFEKTDSFYTVSKRESEECDCENKANIASKSCRLVCDSCNLCIHAFHCTCEDSSIKSNMCKHIHLVGLYLKHQPPESDPDIMSQYTNDGTDVPVGYTENNENSRMIIIEDQVLESVVDIEGISNEKQKLIQRITEQWQEIQSELITSTESKLQHIYNKMIPAVLEAKCSEILI